MSIFGKDARKKTCHDDEDEDKDDKSRVFYAALFRRPDFSDGLLFHGPFIGPKTGFYNFWESHPITRATRKVEATIKYQLQVTSTAKS